MPSKSPSAGRPVALSAALPPFVLAIDIGSGSTRCSLYDSLARPVAKHTKKADHLFTEAADGTAEIDADQIVKEVEHVIGLVTRHLDAASVIAVAMDTFASSLVAVDASGNALTPCFTYADSRSASELAWLRQHLDEEAVHQRVGARLHTSYHPPRLLWLASAAPDITAKTAKYFSLGEYVYLKVAGVVGAATSTMAWAGVLDRVTGELDAELLEVSGTDPAMFSPIVDPDQPLREVDSTVGKRWPALRGAAWFPAVPDGYASNLGVGATTSTTVAMSAATSGAMRTIVQGFPHQLPPGLWSYRVSKRESIVGGALNDVGRVTLWLEASMAPVEVAEINALLETKPTSTTPLFLPFLTGERSTGWAGSARGVMTGLSSTCDSHCLWRGAMEGVALSYARVFNQLRRTNPSIEQVIASGGVAGRYPGLMNVTAQALGFPVAIVDAKRVTMRGAAVLALSVLRPGEPVAELPLEESISVDTSQRGYYDRRMEEFEWTYHQIVAAEPTLSP